jgi:flagellin
MSSILTNSSAMVALQNLKSVNRNLSVVQEQISTGKKIGNAKDNASIFAIATVIKSDVEGFKKISDSLNLGASTVAVARGAAEQVTGLLNSIKGLIVQAQEENVDRTKIQTDVAQLRNQIDSIVGAAQLNGLNLVSGTGNVTFLSSLDRDSSGNVTASNISVARQSLETAAGAGVAGLASTTTGVNGAGTDAAQLVATGNSFTLDIESTATFTAGDVYEVKIDGRKLSYVVQTGDTADDVGQGVTNLINAAGLTGVAATFTAGGGSGDASIAIANTSGSTKAVSVTANDGTGGGLGALASIDVSTQAGAQSALAAIEGLIQTAVDAAAEFGSSQKRIDIQNDFVSTLVDALNTGISALTDADLEEASARLQSLQVQQQLGLQALSIANQAPQSILALFR